MAGAGNKEALRTWNRGAGVSGIADRQAPCWHGPDDYFGTKTTTTTTTTWVLFFDYSVLFWILCGEAAPGPWKP